MADKLLAEWFWVDRWMGSSAFLLPMEARGVYREMLSQAWRRAARLPNDHEAIRRAIGATAKEWARSWPLIERFWAVEDGYLVNETQQQVYADAQSRQESASNRGRAGAQARHRQRLSDAQAHTQASTQALPTDQPPSPSPSPISGTRKITPPANMSVSNEIAQKAGHFLERYPEIYAEERRGAHFALKPVLHFQTACELVRGWPDLKRLELMFRTFCKLPTSEKMAWPGTPAQFLHLAPEIDVRLRQAGA